MWLVKLGTAFVEAELEGKKEGEDGDLKEEEEDGWLLMYNVFKKLSSFVFFTDGEYSRYIGFISALLR